MKEDEAFTIVMLFVGIWVVMIYLGIYLQYRNRKNGVQPLGRKM